MKKLEKNQLKNVTGGGGQACIPNYLGGTTTCEWYSKWGEYRCISVYTWGGKQLSQVCGEFKGDNGI